MKYLKLWKCVLALGSLVLPLAIGCAQQTTSVPVAAGGSSTGAVFASNVTDIVAAPVKPLAMEKLMPASIRPSSPTAEIIKLANSGLDEHVMLAYVTNSQSTFNLDADQIVYLNDIGVAPAVVTAMLQRDQVLQASAANAAAAASAQAQTAVEAPQTVQTEQPATTYTEPATVVTSSTFYDALSPYGSWVEVEGYGLCWQPTVAVVNPGWMPYLDSGRWVYTDAGWYWLSDYSWGWAPFHYGRWFRHNRAGWCWAPDTVWGPSWVTWRYNDEYCGWAPLPPSVGFSVGIGLTIGGRPPGPRPDFGVPPDCYPFVPWRNFQDRHLHQHALPPPQGLMVYHNTRMGNPIESRSHMAMNRGIPASRVASYTHAPVPQMRLREAGAPPVGPGRPERLDPSRKTLSVYRPPVAPAAPLANRPPPGRAGNAWGTYQGGGAPPPASAPNRVTSATRSGPPPSGASAPVAGSTAPPSPGTRVTTIHGSSSQTRTVNPPLIVRGGSQPTTPTTPGSGFTAPPTSATRSSSSSPGRLAEMTPPSRTTAGPDRSAPWLRPNSTGANPPPTYTPPSAPNRPDFGSRQPTVTRPEPNRSVPPGATFTPPPPTAAPRSFSGSSVSGPTRSPALEAPRSSPPPSYSAPRSFSAPSAPPAASAPSFSSRPSYSAPSGPPPSSPPSSGGSSRSSSGPPPGGPGGPGGPPRR